MTLLDRRSTFPDDANSDKTFSERVAQFLQNVDYRLADCAEHREAIFRQRYHAYMRDGAISANSAGIFSDAFDESDNAYLVGVHFDELLVGSIRIHVASREHPESPTLAVFRDVLQPELDAGKVIIDSTRFVADGNFSRLHRGLPYATMRLGVMAAEYFNAHHLLAAVRPEHQAFYRRTFGHRLICEPRAYPHLAMPICLMTVHYAEVAEQVQRKYPFFRSTQFERRMLFERCPVSFQPRAPWVATNSCPIVECGRADVAEARRAALDVCHLSPTPLRVS